MNLLHKKNSFSITLASVLIEDTPVGPIIIHASEQGLTGLHFSKKNAYQPGNQSSYQQRVQSILARAQAQVREYFQGTRKDFDLPIDWAGFNLFQKQVLQATTEIKFGQVRTYAQVAGSIHRPHASRAVGGALSCNPVALVIPCHRVVGSDNGLHGFSAPGGIATKAWLLQHEGIVVNPEYKLMVS